MIDEILRYGPAFLLIAVRALAMIETAPLLSSDAIPQTAKLALAGFVAYAAFPSALVRTWDLSPYGLSFFFLVIGEGIIGVITGFFLTLVFSAFTTAGQFFSLQMGFGASETFDPLSQVENPLLGQYLNLVAMVVFLSIGGFQELFLGGFWRSVQSINIVNLVEGREAVLTMLLNGLSGLFLEAMTISMPILGTLFLTSLSTGLISKAAPQINILSEGFPVSITVAFILIFATLPFMVDIFSRAVSAGFETIETLFIQLGGSISSTGEIQ
ncbi:MAG: flagellar biosynthetic protein FliR [Spirochaetaceae bacterium]|jgi:flagellar biosynthetic protein FliR|nr:flagellar biosynthetic protein FliR [Spirochaetaceae bacterium]